MAQITFNREDAERVLADPDSAPGARLISSLAIGFFECRETATDADRRSLNAARKLLHMIQCAVYDALDQQVEEES